MQFHGTCFKSNLGCIGECMLSIISKASLVRQNSPATVLERPENLKGRRMIM